VACPPGSQADVHIRDLSNVATYVFGGSNLVLNLRADASNMIFEVQPVMSLTDTAWTVNQPPGFATTVSASLILCLSHG